MRAHVVVSVIILNLASGCMPGGELGNGYFEYVCSESPDTACRATMIEYQRVPSPIAVGAVFDLDYVYHSSVEDSVDTGAVNLRPASTERVERTSEGLLRLLDAGEHAILAHDGEVVADMIHLHANEVDMIDIHLQTFTDDLDWIDVQEIQLLVGQTARIEASPVDEDGRVLAGGFELDWQTSDDSVVYLGEALYLMGTIEHVIDIEARAAGEASITVTLGSHQRTIDVVVDEEVAP